MARPDELPIALHLTYVCGLKWDRVVALGHDIRLTRNNVGDVLTCYQKSLTRPDYRAHCWTGQGAVPIEQEGKLRSITLTHDGPRCVVYDRQGNRIPDPAKAPIWLHPCRLAGRFGGGFTTYHPASIREQLEANLMENDCHWCPHLDPGKLDRWAHVLCLRPQSHPACHEYSNN